MPENKHLRFFLKLLYAGVAVLAVWLSFRFLLPCLLPFIIAFAIAGLVEPLVRTLCENGRLLRSFSSALVTLTVLLALFALIVLIASRVFLELSNLFENLPTLLAGLPAVSSKIETFIYKYIIAMPPSVQDFLFNISDKLIEQSMGIPVKIYEWLLGKVTSMAVSLPKTVIFFFTTALATFFMSSNYKDVKSFIMRQIPDRFHDRVRKTKGQMKLTLWQWVKAHLLILAITFCELTVGLLFMRVDYAILLAALIAVVDILPVFGTGTILLPWAIIDLISGNGSQCFSLLLLWAVISIVRNIIEPKLIGDRLGLHPLITLIAMYVGYCTLGITGMIFMPLAAIMLKQLNDWEYIKLWK